MKRTTLIIISVLILAFIGCCATFAVFAWVTQQLKHSGPIALPGMQCEVSSCHGMEYSCGKAPGACDTSYQVGDRCLQHAKCGVVNNRCQRIDNPSFNACRSCVQTCLTKHEDDPLKLFECESQCE